jgi:hypothetical protein
VSPSISLSSRRSSTRRVMAAFCHLFLLYSSLPALLDTSYSKLSAQEIPSAVTNDVGALDTTRPINISPGGAFLRAVIVPGWGHASIGSHTRGGFYFAAQAATVYTLLRTRVRIGTARDRVQLTEGALINELSSLGVTDPDAIQEALNSDGRLRDVRGLLDSRKEQHEDLAAFSIFLVLLSAADAYVSAHLARFPAPLDIETQLSTDGAVDIGIRFQLPN